MSFDRLDRLNKFDLYYEVLGTGEPVIFIPGGFCDHQSWDAIKHMISRDFQMILLDNRGSGLSQDTDEEFKNVDCDTPSPLKLAYDYRCPPQIIARRDVVTTLQYI